MTLKGPSQPKLFYYSMNMYTLLSGMVLLPHRYIHLPLELPVAVQTARRYCSALSDPVPLMNVL